MHCFGAATALTLVQCVGFWGQLGAMSIGACVGFYAPVRASQCVVMSTVTTISLRRVTARWAAARADGQAGQPWACPSPRELHDELAARWSIRHSLAARAGAWRELMSADTAVLRAGGVALHVGPRLVTAADVSALVEWRRTLRGAGSEPPAAWSLGAGGDGRLLLLYSTDATTAEVIEGFGAAWLAANEAADALSAERKVASAGLAAVSVRWVRCPLGGETPPSCTSRWQLRGGTAPRVASTTRLAGSSGERTSHLHRCCVGPWVCRTCR